MLKLFVRLILLLIVGFTVVIGAIRSQSYDDSELRAFLFPEGCNQPCVMDIQPGATTRADVILALQQHKWVAEIIEITDYGVRWIPSEQSPHFISRVEQWTPLPENDVDLVEGFYLRTTVPFAYLRLVGNFELENTYFNSHWKKGVQFTS